MLEELADRWRRHGAPVGDGLQPGLVGEQIDALTAPLGLRLPTEARVWWGWHDGVYASRVRWAREREVVPGLEFLPLAEAVRRCIDMRVISLDWHKSAAGAEPDPWWGPSWFVLTDAGQAGIIAGDCAIPDGAPTPIRCVDPPEPGNVPSTPILGSLGALVQGWIDAFDQGAWTYTDRWQIDAEHRPAISRLLFG
jgi:hypothetical protein